MTDNKDELNMLGYKLIKNDKWKEVDVNENTAEIPSSWTCHQIGTVFEVKGGGTPSTDDPSFWGGSVIWVGPKEMASCVNKKYISRGNRNLSTKGSEVLGSKKIPKNSVVLSTRAPVGYVNISSCDLYTSQGCHSLIPKKEVYSEYAYYWLKSNKELLNSRAAGATFKELAGKELAAIYITVPPLPQQTAIANILSHQESIIQNIEELIAKLEKRKEYITRELLSGRLRVRRKEGVDGDVSEEAIDVNDLEFYKTPEDGWKEVEVLEAGETVEVPAEWRAFCLKDLATVKKGGVLKSSEAVPGIYPVIGGGQKPSTYHTCFNNPAGSITVSASGAYAGFVWKHETPIFATDCSVVLSTGFLKQSFLYYLLKHRQAEIYAFQQGAAQPHVYPKQLESLVVLVPPPEEAITVVTILANSESLIQKTNDLLTKEKQRFEWLSMELLCGKYLVEAKNDCFKN